jgi:signal transduction histidine kinase
MSTWKNRLDPRLHVTSAIGWAVVSVVTLAALAAASLAASQAERRARAAAEGQLAEYATQVRDALSMNLEMRSLALQVAAVQIRAVAERDRVEQALSLQAVQARFAEFDALAITDVQGRVTAAAGGWQRGLDLSTAPWYAAARHAAVVRDQAAAPGVERMGAYEDARSARREVIFAAPLGPGAEGDGAVLAAVVPWAWVEGVLTHMQQLLGESRSLELMLAARDGTVLSGPPHWLGRSVAAPADLTEGGAYLVGRRTQLRLADSLGLGWTAVVRQPADQALAPVRTTRQAVFLIVFLAGLLSALAAVAATRALTRRLEALARDAERVRQGQQDTLAIPRGADEVARIGATLAQVVDRLQAEKRALQTLNAELDRRVAERTVRIERLADEARLAAVSRERLRIARDLHDTLAHSLMALLTQIRLVRKLRTRLDGAELDAELASAEAVATGGLADARAAIAQMRDNSVRESGLGNAVRDLARRVGQRSGLRLKLTVDPGATTWVDERFEAVFRIVEEALRNVERHAQAQQVEIRLGTAAGPSGASALRACIEVADDGCGFDPAAPRPGHYGLRGMQEQAALIGADLRVDSAPGRGTRVRIELEG